jgi:membrane protein
MSSGSATAARKPATRRKKSSGSRAPRLHRDLTRKQWKAIAKGMWGRFGEVQITDRAAALTYYSFLSLFPALIVVIALLALVGQYPETYQSIINTLRDAAPGSAVETINTALRDVLRDRGSAGALLGVGLVISLYSASSAIGAAMRSLETINRVPSGRSFFPNLGVRVGLTVAMMVLVLIAFLAVVIGGPLFGSIAKAAGVSSGASEVVGLIRWPIGAAALLTAIALLYSLGPRKGRKHQRALRSILPGAVVATLLWFVVSLLFTAYVSNFGSYDKTYGTLGALISLLIWLWLGNLSFLLGALFNAESLQVRSRGK